MSPSERRKAITKEFSERERKHMESVMTSRETQRKATELAHDRCQSEDTGTDSDSGPDECNHPGPRRACARTRTTLALTDESAEGYDTGPRQQGISRRSFYYKKGGCVTVYYNADVCLNCTNGVYLFISARQRRELALAVQDHIVLHAVVEHVYANKDRRS
eukprot:TRINITY_DN75896_c0_g1_i1.p1 TRINITY_DN75896_c0_g1~~TRINITY_DN75896_c0_g1_i1.p1  ORF type:complete len:180 (-),score=11.38 TRINITY_DN75896_c0_g1_i1:82-564(-)